MGGDLFAGGIAYVLNKGWILQDTIVTHRGLSTIEFGSCRPLGHVT